MTTKESTAMFSVAVFCAVAVMSLTPVLNIPGPLIARSLDASVAVLLVATLLFVRADLGAAKQPIFPAVLTLFIMFTHMAILEVAGGSGDFEGFSFAARSLITLLAAAGCSLAIARAFPDRPLEFFFSAIAFAAILQGCVLWLSFFFPVVRDGLSLVFYRDTDPAVRHLIMQRVPGFVPTGGDGLSLNHGLICMVGFFGAQQLKLPNAHKKALLVTLFLSAVGAAFTGRSGLYLALFGVSFLFFATKDGGIRGSKFPLFALVVALALSAAIAARAPLKSVGNQLLAEHGYEHPIVRLLKGFIRSDRRRGYQDDTLAVLTTRMVLVPDDGTQFIIGTNEFGRQRPSRVRTDVGYFRMWHGVGLLGVAFFLAGFIGAPLACAHRCRVHLKDLGAERFRRGKLILNCTQFSIVVAVYGALGHYKIMFLTTRVFQFVFFTLLCLIAIETLRYSSSMASRQDRQGGSIA